MTVYVDTARHRLGRMIMSHLAADTKAELFEMVRIIGVNPRHYQAGKRPHFDICQDKKRLAIEAGAVEISPRELVRIFQRSAERIQWD